MFCFLCFYCVSVCSTVLVCLSVCLSCLLSSPLSPFCEWRICELGVTKRNIAAHPQPCAGHSTESRVRSEEVRVHGGVVQWYKEDTGVRESLRGVGGILQYECSGGWYKMFKTAISRGK
jgi:hypothetical protein